MVTGFLAEELLETVLDSARAKSYEYTGSGYFLCVEHPLLPSEPKTLSMPSVVGNSGDIQAGFVVFLGQNELTLECHTWGPVDVPADFRERDVAVSTPPDNFIDLRCGPQGAG